MSVIQDAEKSGLAKNMSPQERRDFVGSHDDFYQFQRRGMLGGLYIYSEGRTYCINIENDERTKIDPLEYIPTYGYTTKLIDRLRDLTNNNI